MIGNMCACENVMYYNVLMFRSKPSLLSTYKNTPSDAIAELFTEDNGNIACVYLYLFNIDVLTFRS